jgi:hypothetical protein
MSIEYFDNNKVGIGNNPNDGNGDPLRTAMDKINIMFRNLYNGITIDTNRVGIGTTPVASALLDVQGTGGIKFPTMTTTTRNAITSPAQGLVVYDTTLNQICYYTGGAWFKVTASAA